MLHEAKNLTDAELVQKTLSEPDFYAPLIHRYQEKLTRYIRRISSISDEDAQDILQEVFIKAYQNLHGYDSRRSFSSWIYRIAHNEVISNFRKIKARPEIAYSIDDETISSQLAKDMGIPEGVDAELQKRHIGKAIQMLDKKYQEIIVLRYFEEKSYEEISEILKKPQGTVATLINRAHKQLQEVITEGVE